MSAIRDFVMAEPLFDNHEHQDGFTNLDDRKDKLTYREFGGYADADLATAIGVPSGRGGPDASTDRGFFDLWSFARTTGYGQATEMACQALLNVQFTRRKAGTISKALQEFARGKTGKQIYAELYKAANVRWVVNDCCWECPTNPAVFKGKDHPAFFGQALRYDGILVLSSRSEVENFEEALGCSVQRLSDLDAALDAYTEKARKAGKLVAMKSAMPYSRRLSFDNSSYAEAEKAFEAIMQGRPTDAKPLHDYLFHRFVQRAREFDLPVQLHTGYLAGNWGDPSQGDPAPLVPIFQRYRKVRFDLFHAGWPYSEVLGAIGKAIPNAWPDMCWAWAMNPAQMERVLSEWLAAVPHNKIFAFGGDTQSPFCTLGYAIQARTGIANVLEEKVESGRYDLRTATQVAGRIMHENAREFYSMTDGR